MLDYMKLYNEALYFSKRVSKNEDDINQEGFT